LRKTQQRQKNRRRPELRFRRYAASIGSLTPLGV
jgi:hypothetical protein